MLSFFSWRPLRLCENLFSSCDSKFLAASWTGWPRRRRRTLGAESATASAAAAAAAVGADGIIVEVHPNPDEAICDGPQALRADDFAEYAAAVERATALAGKALSAA